MPQSDEGTFLEFRRKVMYVLRLNGSEKSKRMFYPCPEKKLFRKPKTTAVKYQGFKISLHSLSKKKVIVKQIRTKCFYRKYR